MHLPVAICVAAHMYTDLQYSPIKNDYAPGIGNTLCLEPTICN